MYVYVYVIYWFFFLLGFEINFRIGLGEYWDYDGVNVDSSLLGVRNYML